MRKARRAGRDGAAVHQRHAGAAAGPGQGPDFVEGRVLDGQEEAGGVGSGFLLLRRADRSQAPVLVVQSLNDSSVLPATTAKAWQNALPGSKTLTWHVDIIRPRSLLAMLASIWITASAALRAH
ncbi:hypothetical protein NOR_00042 [Metarhizium rileyi]|uniref:Uncharacterized protein n=1 Tax=Metarhizium rileyi (strain RCEF 4871) TaxID=1649241 RepID=A0A167KAH7_METRR|nr:hypothetical protein NOR_00042 [Metarhizium rileyi RCEF 4871]